MSSETIVTAIFLITAVVAAGILTSQVFPAITTMSGSVSSSTKSAEQTLRTNIAIVNTFSLNGTGEARVWLKNTGSSRLSLSELNTSTVFIGNPGNIGPVLLDNPADPTESWSYVFIGGTENGFWDPMETLQVTAASARIPGTRGDTVFFQVVLPDGTKRSEEFTVS